VTPVVNNSIWENVSFGLNDYFRLVHCPQGYHYSDLLTNLTRDLTSADQVSMLMADQKCAICDEGLECTSPPCVECSMCRPGFKKSCALPVPCDPCPINAYEDRNGSVACRQCEPGMFTAGLTDRSDPASCVCDLDHYTLNKGECLLCPAGLQCFGNETYIPFPLEVGESKWEIRQVGEIPMLDLVYCPRGYLLDGDVLTPERLQCIPCGAGFECTNPPCFRQCAKCGKGHYKAPSFSFAFQAPGTEFDIATQMYTRRWIEEPCSPCPVNTYRALEGGAEIGVCLSCPDKSTTQNRTGGSALSDCRCDRFYYQQATTSAPGSILCSDCPQGCVCGSDSSCALSTLPPESFAAGDVRSGLQCPNPVDAVEGVWRRNEIGQYRLESCPAGYTIGRTEFSNTSDKCNICPVDTYLLEEARSPSVACKACPTGADCPGGSIVRAKPGYWQRLQGRRAGEVEVAVFQCPNDVCANNNTCKNNRTGPVIARSLFPVALDLALWLVPERDARPFDRCAGFVRWAGRRRHPGAMSVRRTTP
jgi:hypothetical protein